MASLVQTFIVEKFGRKPLLVLSDLFVCISMVAVGIFFKMYESCPECQPSSMNPFHTMSNGSMIASSLVVSEGTVSDIGWVPLVGLMVFVFFFMLGLGPLGWLMNVELMPMEARVRKSKSFMARSIVLFSGFWQFFLCLLQLVSVLPGCLICPDYWGGSEPQHNLLHIWCNSCCGHSFHHSGPPRDQGED